MSEELNVTIYEPSKNPRSVSRDLDPEFVPLVDRVYFNEDGSLCDDFEEYPEDVDADEYIGFNMDLLPSATVQSTTDQSTFVTESVQMDSLPVSQRQKKLQKQINHLMKKDKIYTKNKLQKLRKKLKLTQQREMNDKLAAPQNADPSSNQENCIDPIVESTSEQKELRQFNEPANSKPFNRNLNANRKPFIRKNKKKAPKSANGANASTNPRFPSFIRNPWLRKNPKNASKKNTSANSSDYIPISRNGPQFRYNGRIPPLTNSSRYFSLDNC